MELTLREMVLKQFELQEQLDQINKQIHEKVISDHAEYRVGDVAPHDYRGGGEMIVDKIDIHGYHNKVTDMYSFSIYYRGRGIKKSGDVGTMEVTNFGDRNNRPEFKLKDCRHEHD